MPLPIRIGALGSDGMGPLGLRGGFKQRLLRFGALGSGGMGPLGLRGGFKQRLLRFDVRLCLRYVF